MRNVGVAAAVAVAAVLSGCAIQRAQVAQDARAQMVGMSKEQVLACMGPPGQRAAEGATEVWNYASGDGTVLSGGSAQVYNGGFGGATVSGSSVSSRRFCNINVVMTGGNVAAVNYQGPTGGLLTGGEQCAYAVATCVKKQ
jgi:hypothetical protein